MPSPYSLPSGLVPARSLPCSRSTRYCAGDSLRRHSSSLNATAHCFAGARLLPPRRPNRPSAITFPLRTGLQTLPDTERRCRAAPGSQCTRSPLPGTGRSNSAVERAIQHHTTQVSSSSPRRNRCASCCAISAAAAPCRRTRSKAASQILRSLVIIIIRDIITAKPRGSQKFPQIYRVRGAVSQSMQYVVPLASGNTGAACADLDHPYIRAMPDLFDTPIPRTPDSYSAKDIEVLEGLEPVRRRPGMYVGGTDERGLHHLAAEVLDNAMDEAVAGHATRIEIELGYGNWVTVRDNGRGIPVDRHPRFPDNSALEVILTTVHSGGKFGGHAFRTSGVLHGVSVSVVNALADR